MYIAVKAVWIRKLGEIQYCVTMSLITDDQIIRGG